MSPIDVALCKRFYSDIPTSSLKIYLQRLQKRWRQNSTYLAGLIMFVRVLEHSPVPLARIERYKRTFDYYLKDHQIDLTDLQKFAIFLKQEPPVTPTKSAQEEIFIEW